MLPSGQSRIGPADGWNSPRALELIDRARTVRSSLQIDSAFQSYQARANGYVYFFIDRPDEAERTLIKADQIALEVFWRAPDETGQRIIGLRDEAVLPTNIRYHLDHLTVVQDEFGDQIRLGDGDEVESVMHPVAPGSGRLYDFRLADSLTIEFGGVREPVRVYEIQVRPVNPDRPAFVGNVFIDRDTGSIVRMSFTFTAASYVDPYLDYIRISLDNSLWMERYWLPYRQEVELRREMPAIDFLAGSIIRGRFEIGEYDFNLPLPDVIFRTGGVTSVSPAQREAFPFEDDLYHDLNQEGLAPSAELERIQDQVRAIAMEDALGGLNPLRLHWPSFSDGLRYNRTEGWVTSAGTSVDLGDNRLRLLAGWAFGPGEVQAQGTLSRAAAGGRVSLTWRQSRSRDLGPLSGASGVINTISSAAGRDYSDLFRVTGAEVMWQGAVAGRGVELRVRAEEESARAVTQAEQSSFRAAPGVSDQRRLSARAAVQQSTNWGGRIELAADVGLRSEPGIDEVKRFAGMEVTAAWEKAGFGDALGALIELRAGQRLGSIPGQDLYWMGGRGTIPGFDFRDRAGTSFVLIGAEVGRVIARPWISMHLLARTGWTRAGDSLLDRPAQRLPAEGWRSSLGAGADLFWETVRLDIMRGLPDGRWELVFSVRPDLAGWL